MNDHLELEINILCVANPGNSKAITGICSLPTDIGIPKHTKQQARTKKYV